ncbi:MAG TPA: hypothetical protein VFK47_15190 [Ktedonobacteraceae bacterium]|nr:hypothetical protein [Ktedonobacteraceae bacterium]
MNEFVGLPETIPSTFTEALKHMDFHIRLACDPRLWAALGFLAGAQWKEKFPNSPITSNLESPN